MSPTREAILEAALGLFTARGFDGTPVPMIAEAAGVATGTIYRHFPSKEALVNALYRHWKGVLRERLVAAAAADEAPRVGFARLWDGLCRFQADAPAAFAFLEHHFHAPYLDAQSLAVEDEVLALARAWAEAARAAGALKPFPTDLLIAVVFGAFTNVVKQRELGRLSPDPQTLAQAERCCWAAIAGE